VYDSTKIQFLNIITAYLLYKYLVASIRLFMGSTYSVGTPIAFVLVSNITWHPWSPQNVEFVLFICTVNLNLFTILTPSNCSLMLETSNINYVILSRIIIIINIIFISWLKPNKYQFISYIIMFSIKIKSFCDFEFQKKKKLWNVFLKLLNVYWGISYYIFRNIAK